MESTAGAMIMFMMLISMLLPLLMLGLMFLAIGFWIWMIVDCTTNDTLTDNDKLIWVLVVVLTNWIGALIYFFAGRSKYQTATPINTTQPPQPPSQPQLPPPLPAQQESATTQEKEYSEF